jgi:DNA-binding MarR family transcriptional regulator
MVPTKTKHAPPTEQDRTAVELGLAVKRFRARMRAETATAEGWTISQLSTLNRLITFGPMTASELAQAEHVRPQSVAEVVAALRAESMVVAEPHPTDGRKSQLFATPAGRALIDQLSAERGSWLARAIDAEFGPDERDELVAAIGVLDRLADCDLGTGADPGWRA